MYQHAPVSMKVGTLYPSPTTLVVGEGFMPSRKRAGINPARTMGEGGRPGEGGFSSQ